jgi:hypothetical protein
MAQRGRSQRHVKKTLKPIYQNLLQNLAPLVARLGFKPCSTLLHARFETQLIGMVWPKP